MKRYTQPNPAPVPPGLDENEEVIKVEEPSTDEGSSGTEK